MPGDYGGVPPSSPALFDSLFTRKLLRCRPDIDERRIKDRVLFQFSDKGIAELEALLKAAQEEIASLKERIAVLEKNSSNSSRPPSSDIVKPPRKSTPKGKKRKRGAQKGHKRNLRKPFEENQVDQIVPLDLKACPTCGGNRPASD